MSIQPIRIFLLSAASCGLLIASTINAQETPSKPSTSSSPTSTPVAAKKPAEKTKSKVDEPKSVRPDRLDLDMTSVTGNRELPKVLYIVPWKKAELGELPAQPFNTLLDEILQPVDRDVFRREVKYFDAVSSGAARSSAPANTAPK